MRNHPRSRPPAGQCLAAVAEDVALPVPFTMSGIRSQLERHCRRSVHLAPAEMEAGSPAGILFRTAAADYMYYEARTSPFHQAHIVLHLAAHLLLDDAQGPVLDPRVVSEVGPALIRMILGDDVSRPVTEPDAETFAFLALEDARPSVSRHAARRLIRQLEPLREALLDAVPEAASAPVTSARPGASRLLYQVVIEIRDAALALRPYRDPHAVPVPAATGLDRDELAATVEAGALAHAARARKTGRPATRHAALAAAREPALGPDLGSDAEWLAQVARAFSRQVQGGEAPCRPGGDDMPADG